MSHVSDYNGSFKTLIIPGMYKYMLMGFEVLKRNNENGWKFYFI
jgi:hypothetical protein